MKYSVCIDALYMNNKEKDFFAGLTEANMLGYKNFEFWTWWDKDIDKVIAAKNKLGMNLVACCTKFVSLTNPSSRAEYLEGLRESIAAAKKLGTTMLISQVGDDTGAERKLQHDSIVQGLKEAAPLLAEAGITLVIEPLNTTVDHKGYYLYSSDEGFDIIKAVNSPNVKLLFDLYHQQIMEGNLISRATQNLDLIGHFHAAGNPGRHELSSGELCYPEIFKALDKAGYQGFTGLEYFPLQSEETGLKEILAY